MRCSVKMQSWTQSKRNCLQNCNCEALEYTTWVLALSNISFRLICRKRSLIRLRIHRAQGDLRLNVKKSRKKNVTTFDRPEPHQVTDEALMGEMYYVVYSIHLCTLRRKSTLCTFKDVICIVSSRLLVHVLYRMYND